MTTETIYFKSGLPGFEELHHYVLKNVEGDLPMKLLQPADEEGISFLVANPFLFYPSYEWDLPQSVTDELEIESENDVEIWSIITVPLELQQATINLLAPLVINKTKHFGKQHIIHDSQFSPRTPLFQKASTASQEGGE